MLEIFASLLCFLGLANYTPPEPTIEIANLIKNLGDESFKTRRLSEKKLEDCGWEAIGGLLDAINSKDPEVAERANNLVQKWCKLKSYTVPVIYTLPEEQDIKLPSGRMLRFPE